MSICISAVKSRRDDTLLTVDFIYGENDHCHSIPFSIFPSSFFVLVFLIILSATPLSAQKKTTPNKLFETKQYYAAAQAYEKELANEKGNPVEIWKKIGLSYLNINQPQKALYWLQQIANSGNADAEMWYQYGLALQQTAAYLEAIAAFEQCLGMKPGYPMAQLKIESCKFAMTNHRVNPYANFSPAVGVNTTGGEFGVSLYTNNIVYYSLAAAPFTGAKIDQRTGLQHVQTYMMRRQNKRFVYPLPADNTLPKHITDGLFAYDSISSCIYFEYCNPENSRCGIHSSKLINGKWSDPEIIYLNKKDQVSGHPAIANGGNRLYFTSNSPEGIGQTDIWYMDRAADGKWGAPVNAGKNINTLGREQFPFVYADTLLFFASDGHVGYGGLDIFCSVVKGNSFSPPVNLRRPFNSPGDDFNLIISGNTGILSSSRNESVSDDLYFFEGLPSFLYLSGHVTDQANGAILNNARLTLTVEGNTAQQTVSDSTGYYGFFLRNNESPTIYARLTGYKPSLTDVSVTSVAQFTDFQHDIQLQLSTIPPVNILLYNKITGRPISERTIICFNNDGEEQILRTNSSGTFNLTMQEDQREYWIKFPDGNFLTESILLFGDQLSYSLAVQPINETLFADWLLFKKGSVEAVEMSQALIPRIASIIKANQGMVFLIEGFCDTVFEVNQQELAHQRANYIARRLVDEGVDSRQLFTNAGVDEMKTIEEETYQRRVEIKIKK